MKNKLYFIIVATLLCPTSLYAQSGTDKRSVLSFQTGPTLYTGKLIGIAGYSSNLRNGIGWSGSYTYLVGNKPAIRAGFGILCVQAGYWLYPVVTRAFFRKRYRANIFLSPYVSAESKGLALQVTF